jgi:hypothetical protein
MIIPKRILKIMTILLIASAGSSLILCAYLMLYYMRTMPGSPHPDIGQVCPLNIHGAIVYITKQQDSFLTWLLWISTGAGLIAGIINVKYKMF